MHPEQYVVMVTGGTNNNVAWCYGPFSDESLARDFLGEYDQYPLTDPNFETYIRPIQPVSYVQHTTYEWEVS